MRPADIGFFEPMKTKMRAWEQDALADNATSLSPVTKFTKIGFMEQAILEVGSKENHLKSLEKSGILPFNRKKLLLHDDI